MGATAFQTGSVSRPVCDGRRLYGLGNLGAAGVNTGLRDRTVGKAVVIARWGFSGKKGGAGFDQNTNLAQTLGKVSAIDMFWCLHPKA